MFFQSICWIVIGGSDIHGFEFKKIFYPHQSLCLWLVSVVRARAADPAEA
jgi:hypothetical protein